MSKTTFEHGKADADAPVTWQQDRYHFTVKSADGFVFFELRTEDHEEWEIQALCRAFHLAKLAEESAGMLDELAAHTASDWLRRYRAAKGA